MQDSREINDGSMRRLARLRPLHLNPDRLVAYKHRFCQLAGQPPRCFRQETTEAVIMKRYSILAAAVVMQMYLGATYAWPGPGLPISCPLNNLQFMAEFYIYYEGIHFLILYKHRRLT